MFIWKKLRKRFRRTGRSMDSSQQPQDSGILEPETDEESSSQKTTEEEMEDSSALAVSNEVKSSTSTIMPEASTRSSPIPNVQSPVVEPTLIIQPAPVQVVQEEEAVAEQGPEGQALVIQQVAPDPKLAYIIFKTQIQRNQSANMERRARKLLWIFRTQKQIAEIAQFRSTVSELFPEKVWKLIFAHVEDSKVKARMSNMSEVWRKVLEPQRTTFLIHGVFPVLRNSGHLPKNDVLNCRLVSKEWRKAVLNSIRIPNEVRPLSLLELYKIRVPIYTTVDQIFIELKCDWAQVAEYTNWSVQKERRNRNPIFSRKLRLGCVCSTHTLHERYNFWNEVDRFLERWGKEVWHLEFHFPTVTACEAYGAMYRVLGQTPYLKFLGFYTPKPLNEENLEPFLEYFFLPELIYLDTIAASSFPPPILKAMLWEYKYTLEKVATRRSNIPLDTYANTVLPNLNLFILSCSRKDVEEEPQFPVDWPSVDELDIHYKDFNPLHIPALFRSLSVFRGSLSKLHLKLENQKGIINVLDGNALNRVFLELGNIQYFSLSMDMGAANLKSIDFIMPMEFLKELKLCYVTTKWPPKRKGKNSDDEEIIPPPTVSPKLFMPPKVPVPDDPRDIIQFWNYTWRMYESNIWKLFPDLRKFTIVLLDLMMGSEDLHWGNETERVYTQEGYRNHFIENAQVAVAGPSRR